MVSLELAGTRIGDKTRLSISPSVEHFLATRKDERGSHMPSAAWIGAAGDDSALKSAARALPDLLKKHRIKILPAPKLPDFSNCEFAILVAHGNPNSWGEMVSISDDIRALPPEELGSLVPGVGCLVLGVCFAGVSQNSFDSQECWRAVSSALASGVKCVVAPSFAIQVSFLAAWLDKFIPMLQSGMPVAEAADKASCEGHIRLAERFAMQVYGDGQFRMTCD